MEKRIQNVGIYQELQAHESTDLTPRRRDNSRLFAVIVSARTYCSMIITVRCAALPAPPKTLLEAPFPSKTSNGFTYSVIQVGYIAGAPKVSRRVNRGRWEPSIEISGTLLPAQVSKDGINPSVTYALAIVVFRSSLVPCSMRQSNTGPHSPLPW